MLKIIDTSKWQNSKVDYVAAKKAGYAGVILRIGCGNTKDKCFENDYKAAIAAGLLVGVYFYTYSTTEVQAVQDATRVLGWLNNRHLDLPVAYDLEDAKQKGTSRKEINSAMYNAFAAKIKTKYDCMLYTGEYFYNNYFNKSVVRGKLWIARYSEKAPYVGRSVYMWQYTSDAISTDFYKQKLDRSYLYDLGAEKPIYDRSELVTHAKMWLGYNEADGSHKQIVDVYNNHKPLARGYTVKYTDSWCATYVSAVAINAGYTDIIPTECSCQKMIDLFKSLGTWVEDDSYVPKPGDIMFYDWQDSGSSDNTGWSDHVGIVISVEQGVISVIEGNYNNAVKVRKLNINGKYIRGYGVPAYDDDAEETNPYPVPTRNLKRTYPMMKGNDVKWLQWELNQKGYNLEVDGKFGNDTKNAVRAYQKDHGLKVDGIVGSATRYSMQND